MSRILACAWLCVVVATIACSEAAFVPNATAAEPAPPTPPQPSAASKPTKDVDAKPSLDDLQKNLLVVTLSGGGEKLESAALLVRRDAKYAYFVTPQPSGEFLHLGMGRKVALSEIKTEVREALGELAATPAENMGLLPDGKGFVFRAPAAALKGKGFSHQPKVAENQEVNLRGIHNAGEGYKPITLDLKAGQIWHEKNGALKGFYVSGFPNEPPDMGIFLNSQGFPVGAIWNTGRTNGTYYSFGIDHIIRLGLPSLGLAMVLPIEGDERTITYDFFVDVMDPLGELGKGQLAVARVSQTPGGVPTEKMPETGVELLDLTAPQPLHPLAQSVIGDGRGKILRARCKLKNTGDPDSDLFILQVRAEKPEASPPQIMLVYFNPGRFRSADLPAIPGLHGIGNGAAIRLSMLPGGNIQLTSKARRPTKSKPAAGEAPNLAPPVNAEKSLLKSEKAYGDGWKRVLLKVEVAASDRALVRPLCWSRDGEHLFLIDKDEILRKIRTKDWQQVATRQLEPGFDEICHSMTQLAVKGQRWLVVLNPDTLETGSHFSMEAAEQPQNVKRQQTIVTARHNDIAVVAVDGLMLVDLLQGTVLHHVPNRVKTDRGSDDLRIEGEPILRQIDGLFMNGAGTKLYTLNGSIVRYRLEEGNLIYEATSPREVGRCMNADGTRMLIGQATNNSPRQQIIDPREFKPAYAIEAEAPLASCFDPRANDLWLARRGEFLVFNTEGNQKKRFAVEKQETVEGMWPDPQGGRAAIWSKNEITVHIAPQP